MNGPNDPGGGGPPAGDGGGWQQPQGGWQQQPQGEGYPPGQPQQPMAGQAGPPPFAAAKATGYPPNDNDKEAAFYAHLFGALANVLFCGLAVPVVAPLIALAIKKERGPFALYHINQAMVFQGVLFAANVVLAIVISIVALFTCGIGGVLFVLNGIPPLIGLVYGIVVALSAKEGQWSEYAVIGPKVLNMKSPLIKQ